MSLDYDREMVTMGPDKSKSFALPDGAILTVTQPQVQVPELLVNPSVGTPELWKAVGLAGPPPSQPEDVWHGRVDRWRHVFHPVHVRGPVDHQGAVRGARRRHCAPQVSVSGVGV